MRVRVVFGGLLAAAALMCAPALASAQGVISKKLHMVVHIGPGQKTKCNIVAELFKPASASKKHPDPAVLMTNGFDGSYATQAPIGKEFAKDGYVALSYSGLGFGGSSCRISLDSTQWDGETAKQLVTFLGGGLKATNGTKVNYVAKQKRAPNGKEYKYDPRVGMLGVSYGGAVQFAAAADDPRIDTIIPIATWNNLAYSLAPNNASLKSGTVSYTTPGITKSDWLDLFWLLGEYAGKPVAPYGGATNCPNFAQFACVADSNLTTDGYPDAATMAAVKDTSVANFMNKVRIPTMLMQGEDDTLFTLHEAVATYKGLRKQHTPVKMVWQSWGHSDLTPQPGEFGNTANGDIVLDNSNGTPTVEGRMILGWLNYYLKHTGKKPALNFSFYRPWVKYKNNDASAAYASASKYPVGKTEELYLSGQDSLVQSSSQAQAGAATFTTPASSSAAQSQSDDPDHAPPAPSDPPGTYAQFETAPLTSNLNVVGIPSVKVSVSVPAAAAAAPSLDDTVGLYFKVEDIAPDGSVTLPDGLVTAARVSSTGAPTTVDLPGIVHQFKAGDRLALVIAGSDASYFLANPNTQVTVSAGSGKGVLSLPVSSSFSKVKLTR